ncbi:unnamed protein product [Heligmosomoides polygyrus]|uniref:DUF19 domain-containing protein n=1 Tax=Heligmosomoides polygyrus TaxID=6339 RepID=A0A183GC38_HELPZ|nr:unnamed protein product [Heligmosomoides polygyrus]
MLSFVPFIVMSILPAPVAAAVVTVNIVGESMCPDTSRFMDNQLMPVYQKYRNYLKINYHPFGPLKYAKCSRTADGIRCKCQHGPEECKKNSLQACIIHYFPDNYMETLACTQGYDDFDEVFGSCIASKYAPAMSQKIHTCATSDEGRGYVADHGDVVRRQISNELDWVPWISIGGRRVTEAEYDLEQVLCKKFFQPVPPECSNFRF